MTDETTKAREKVADQVQKIDELDPTPETEPGKGETKYDGGEIPRVAKRGSMK